MATGSASMRACWSGREPALALHQPQHVGPPPQSHFQVAPGVVARRRPRQHRQQRGLARGQLRGRPAEEPPRGGLDAVGPGAVVDAVEVLLQQGLLAQRPLELQRCQHLAQLARAVAPVRLQGAGELHGDGRRARAHAPVAHGQPGRPQHRPPVHPAVLEEAMVLARQRRGDGQRVNATQRHPGRPARRPPAAAPAAAGPRRSTSASDCALSGASRCAGYGASRSQVAIAAAPAAGGSSSASARISTMGKRRRRRSRATSRFIARSPACRRWCGRAARAGTSPRRSPGA